MIDTNYNMDKNTTDKFGITELEYLFYDLCSILKSDTSKHSADIIASKAVVYPRLDRMREIIASYNEQPSMCSQCPLKHDADDRRIAKETIERVCMWLSNPSHYEPLMTYDEADAIRHVLNQGE